MSKKFELENPDLKQQFTFLGRIDEDSANMFFVIEKSEETTFDFSKNYVTAIWFNLVIDHI